MCYPYRLQATKAFLVRAVSQEESDRWEKLWGPGLSPLSA